MTRVHRLGRRCEARGLSLPVFAVVAALTATGAVVTGASTGSAADAGQQQGTRFGLVSVTGSGAAADADSGQPALSADGRYTAFVQQSPAPSWEPGFPDVHGVYVHDRLSGATTLVSDVPGDDATAPSISANGRLVAEQTGTGAVRDGQIAVADRQATGRGTYDAPGNLTISQVTDNAGDPHYQHILACPFTNTTANGDLPTRCGPQLSADGSTLAYPAELRPGPNGFSPVVDPGPQEVNATGRILDFVPSSEMADGSEEPVPVRINYINGDSTTIQLIGQPSVTGPFSLTPTDCGTLEPGQGCQFTVTVNPDACPADGSVAELTGDLTTNAVTPDGQSELELVAPCGSGTGETTEFAGRASPAACPAVPGGLPVLAGPAPTADNQGNPLVDFGQREVGSPVVEWVPVTGPGEVRVVAPDCSIQLIDPVAAGLAGSVPPDLPAPCHQGEELVTGSCTGYFLVYPGSVATRAAMLSVGPGVEESGVGHVTYLAVTGVRHVIVLRHGPDFAASPGIVANVTTTGVVMPGAGHPTLSATGRYLAFSAQAPLGASGVAAQNDQVWRHDTDSAGNGGHLSGATTLVSCLPGADTCRVADRADAPAISGDGSTVAFTATTGTEPTQVYARDIATGGTRLVSSAGGLGGTEGDLPSVDPVLSADGSTVAFVSSARNLLPRPVTGEAVNLYLVDLAPGSPGLMAVAPTDAGLADGGALGEPALDAHGRITALRGNARLTADAPSDVDSTYTFERLGRLAADPPTVGYGRLLAGLPAQNRGVTVTDVGPGPATVTGAGVDGPYTLVTDTCLRLVLHPGQHCDLGVRFTPTTAGTHPGALTVTTADDGEAAETTSIGLAATVAVPTSPLLSVSPSVAVGGEVVTATGLAFPASSVVDLHWSQGLGTGAAVTDSTGRFTATLVIQPDDVLGVRTLVATGPTGTALATTRFLVDRRSEEPPFANSGSGN
jgi:hypothetical protein